MTTRRGGLLLALVAGTVGISGCSPSGTEQQVEFRVPVTVREVGTGSVEDRVVATGTLRAAEIVTLRADTSGELLVARDERGRRLAEGDHVDAGELIAMITGEDVRLAARTAATLRAYQAAQRDYESKKRLLDEGLLSEQEFRPVETTLAETKLEWERSRRTEDRSHLVTPISGIVLRLARDETDQPLADGQLVNQGFEVARVAATRELIADVDLVGPDLSRAKPGMSARVRHHAWDGESFGGELVRLAPALDPTTRTLRAEVRVDNQHGKLRPGMFVEVTLVAARHEDVPVVPRGAVTEREGRKVVFVVKGQRVSQRQVALGLGDDEVVEIQGGIEVGERVVVRGIETLIDGTKVRVTGA